MLIHVTRLQVALQRSNCLTSLTDCHKNNYDHVFLYSGIEYDMLIADR